MGMDNETRNRRKKALYSLFVYSSVISFERDHCWISVSCGWFTDDIINNNAYAE